MVLAIAGVTRPRPDWSSCATTFVYRPGERRPGLLRHRRPLRRAGPDLLGAAGHDRADHLRRPRRRYGPDEITATELLDEAIEIARRSTTSSGIYLARFDEPAREAAAAADEVYAAGDQPGRCSASRWASRTSSPRSRDRPRRRAWCSTRLGRPAATRRWCSRLRAAGGVITGKTTTMEFAIGVPDCVEAVPDPAQPVEPRPLDRRLQLGHRQRRRRGSLPRRAGHRHRRQHPDPGRATAASPGIKATFGRVPKSGCVPLGYSLDNIGPMARSARDCAIMLQVLAGYDASDAVCCRRAGRPTTERPDRRPQRAADRRRPPGGASSGGPRSVRGRAARRRSRRTGRARGERRTESSCRTTAS